MAEMTKAEIEQIIKDYLSTRQIELKDFTTISGVDGTTYVLLVQPTGTANKMDVNLLKKQLVAEIKEPADLVINEVKEAGKEVALVVEAATLAVGEANTAASNADEAARVAEQAALNVKDGKTPVFGTVTATGGDKAAATYKLNGVDANNNPKYDVAFVLPKGADGKHPVLQSGNITTLAPSEKVQASFRANGYDADGRPIYLVDLGIPKGDKGQAGDGSGNVLINPAGLKKDARYLFSPKADGSAEGALVEYVEPVIGITNLVSDSHFDSGDVNGWDSLYGTHKVENSIYIKTFTRLNEAARLERNFILDAGLYTLSIFAISPKDIEWRDFVKAEVLNYSDTNSSDEFKLYSVTFNVPSRDTVIIRGYVSNIPIGGQVEMDWFTLVKGNKAPTDFTLSPEDQKAEIEAQITSKGYQTASDVKSAIDAKVSYLTGSNTIATLTSIPTTKRTILATLSAATNIELEEPLDVGKEILISINPTADFEQPLPVSGGWQSLDGDTLSLKAGKLAELSILCVGDSKYVLSSKVAE